MRFLDRVSSTEGVMQFLERLVRWWPLMIGTGAVSWLTGWAASATTLLSAYSPLSWVIGAIVGGLAFISGYFVWGSGLKKVAQAAVYRAAQQIAHDVNPLEDSFDTKRIRVTELADPVTLSIHNKTFVNCELIGPGVVAFSECTFDEWRGVADCDFIVVRGDKKSFSFQNIIFVSRCHFKRPKFLKLVLLFNKDTMAGLDKFYGGKIEWLTTP